MIGNNIPGICHYPFKITLIMDSKTEIDSKTETTIILIYKLVVSSTTVLQM